MSIDTKKAWEDFLNPDVLRPRLLAASIYLIGFEALKYSIIERLRTFFCHGFNESGDVIDPRYEADVLTRKRSPVYASLDWLLEMGAIKESDLVTFERVKGCRNKIAHELLSAVGSDGLPQDFGNCLGEMVALLRKIEVWWIINVDMAVDPEINAHEVDEDNIAPGPIVNLHLLVKVALGNDVENRRFYEDFLKMTRVS